MSSEPFSNKLCNPFAADIFPEGDAAALAGASLHHEAQERLEALIAEAAAEPNTASRQTSSRIILLKAPRAGYGKTHLLSQLSDNAREQAFLIPLQINPDQAFSWKMLLEQVVHALHHSGEPPNPTPLDLIARRAFAFTNASLIRKGKIPCENPEEAAASLILHAAELFDFAGTDQPVARWFQEHFERLLPSAAAILSEETRLPGTAASIWLRALCGYAQGAVERDPARAATLLWALRQPEAT